MGQESEGMMGRAVNGAGSVYQTPTGWRGSIMVKGRRKYASGSSKTAVYEKLQEIKRQADAGFVQKGRSPKLGAWVEHWLDATAPLADLEESNRAKRHSAKTDESYRTIVRLYLPEWLANITLSKLTAENLEDAYSDLSARKLGQSTVYRLHAIIRASLAVAVKRGHVPLNVAQNVISPPRSATVKKLEAYSRADQAAIRESFTGTRSEARWELALTLGPRPGEVLGLEWKHIDFSARTIRIEQQLQTISKQLTLVPYTKTDSSVRLIPMPQFLADLLQQWKRDQLLERGAAGSKWDSWEPDGKPHSFVFTSAVRPGRPITPSGDATQWERIQKRAGLPPAPPYKARHTAASEMIAAGIELTVVAEILGHANTKILQEVYAHAIEERKVAAATVLDFARATRTLTDAEIDAETKKAPLAK